jgi:hypothetical protein
MTMKKSLATVVAVALLSGCGTSTPNLSSPPPSTDPVQVQTSANWPKTLDALRIQWSAEPGIDLTTGPSVAIRAYLESYDVASYTFDLGETYLGFLRATPPNVNRHADGALFQLINVRPLGDDYTLTPKDARPHYGFIPYHMLELRPLGAGYEATVCRGSYADFVQSTVRPGKFVSMETDDKTGKALEAGATSGVYVHRVEFTQHDPRVGLAPPQPPNAPQTGPAPAPGEDVFGSWFVTGSSVKFWGPVENPDTPPFPTPELEQRCADSMPQNEAERTAMMTGYKDAPPAHGDPVPGWPAEAK